MVCTARCEGLPDGGWHRDHAGEAGSRQSQLGVAGMICRHRSQTGLGRPLGWDWLIRRGAPVVPVRECPRCFVATEAKLERLAVLYVDTEVGGETRRVYCPHYQKSAVTPAAFEISRNMRDVFKDSFSCTYCPFRILEPSGALYCPYTQLDLAAHNLFFVEPNPDVPPHQPTHRLTISYWKCANCHSLIEASRKESSS